MTAILMMSWISIIRAQDDEEYLQGVELIDRNDYKQEQTETKANNPNAVSVLTKNQFAKDYPNATDIYFLKTNNYYQVSFKSDKKKVRAYYDFNNQLIGTTRLVEFKDIPEKARQEIKDKYKGYSVSRVFLFELNPHNDSYPNNDYQYLTLFGTRFEKASNYFVELRTDNTELILKVSLAGEMDLFRTVNL